MSTDTYTFTSGLCARCGLSFEPIVSRCPRCGFGAGDMNPPLGWRCPVCGRGLAPDVKECSCSTEFYEKWLDGEVPDTHENNFRALAFEPPEA